MGRIKSFLYESFWGFAVVAIVLLAPSSGLITLAVPDEPYGSTVGIPDTSHLNKRASDDSEHFVFDATFATYDLHPDLFTFDEVAAARRNDPYAAVVSPNQIRAPPNRSFT